MEPKCRYRIHNIPLLICVLSHIIVAQTLRNYFFTMQPSTYGMVSQVILFLHVSKLK
jgi:hypothetical protein